MSKPELTCIICEKPLSGRQTKFCSRTCVHRDFRAKNKDKIAAYARKYRAKNKDKRAAYRREYRTKNKDKLNAHAREHYAKNTLTQTDIEFFEMLNVDVSNLEELNQEPNNE